MLGPRDRHRPIFTSFFVHEQREHVWDDRLDLLHTPRETVLWPAQESTAQRLGLSRPI